MYFTVSITYACRKSLNGDFWSYSKRFVYLKLKFLFNILDYDRLFTKNKPFSYVAGFLAIFAYLISDKNLVSKKLMGQMKDFN